MSDLYARRAYKVSFNVPAYNATYTFIRHESGGFQYGNGSAVTILKNDTNYDILDTRYDIEVMKNFTEWCEHYLRTMFDNKYESKWEELKGQPYFD